MIMELALQLPVDSSATDGISPPPPTFYKLTEDGNRKLTEDGNLKILE